mmetsp:Transcript_54486/g.81125  ORF Transcript_54486/g.81125 Transcript_54486/m.81125 type:complete len:264 (+) Transcript_54486:883-1674(+)
MHCEAYKKTKTSCWNILFGRQGIKCLFMAIILRLLRENWALIQRFAESSHNDGNGSVLKETISLCKNEICGCSNDAVLDQQGVQSLSSYVYGTVSSLSFHTFDYISPMMASGWVFDGIDTLSSVSCLGTCFLSWGLSVLGVYLLHQVVALFRLPNIFHQLVNTVAILPILANSWFVSLAGDLGCTNALIALTSALVLYKYEFRRTKSRKEGRHEISKEEYDASVLVYNEIGSCAYNTSYIVALVVGIGLMPSPFSAVTISPQF